MKLYATMAIMHRQQRGTVEVKTQLSIKGASNKAEAEGILLDEVKKSFPAMEGWNIGTIDSLEITPELLNEHGYYYLKG